MWKKNHTNKEIYSSIANTYDDQIPVLRTIQKLTKTINDDQWSIFDRPREGIPKRTDLKEAIQNVLLYNPYASTKKIAKKVNTDRKTDKRVLIVELQILKVNFKWIPHYFTQENKVKRVEISTELFEFLTNANDQKLCKVLTQDETWIYFINPRNSM